MKLTIVQPAISKLLNTSYVKTWQMEPLNIATVSALLDNPKFKKTFFDDRTEEIDYSFPTDYLLLPIETYTARRSYQIIQEFRRHNPKIKVIAGGFHTTLIPDEVKKYADTIVTGQFEEISKELCEDILTNKLKEHYIGVNKSDTRVIVDRQIYQGRKYMPIGLVETGRGCKFPCDFCSVQTFFERKVTNRNIEQIVSEITELKKTKNLFFFVDDNFAGNIKHTKELLKAITPLKIRAITQLSINACFDEELLCLMEKAGLKGVLIGFESVNVDNLKDMNKRFNTMKGGFDVALANLKKHNIIVYGTFVFGYEHDSTDTFMQTYELAMRNNMYLAAFNHLIPFPGTPLYKQLKAEGRLIYDKWWLEDDYRYGTVPFQTKGLTPKAIEELCIEYRRKFYSLPSILKRSVYNYTDNFMFRNFFPANLMHNSDIEKRNQMKLGDSRIILERKDV